MKTSCGNLAFDFQRRPSGDMALRIEKAFGVKMETLMRMQSNYDIAKTRSREKEIKGIRRFHSADVGNFDE